MFNEIEKEYRKGLQEKRFLGFYWRRAIPVSIIAIVLSIVFRQLYLAIHLATIFILLGIAAAFFVYEFYKTKKLAKVEHRQKSVAKRDKGYLSADNTARIDHLATNLAKHDIRTKEHLKLALEYYESRLPIDTKPNLINWILTTVVTISSIVIVAYDEATDTIDVHRFISIFVSALVVAALCITPVLVFKFTQYFMSRFRNTVDTVLVEDLAYIYIHFEEYKVKLER